MVDDRAGSRAVVYAICAGGLVKIGMTTNLKKRMETLQTMCPSRIALVGVMAGGYQAENRLHRVFAAYRDHGEWFQLDDEALRCLRDQLNGASGCLPKRHFSRSVRRVPTAQEQLVVINRRK